jgi:hypothetical protein
MSDLGSKIYRGYLRVAFLRNMQYTYLGDRNTDPALKGAPCNAVRRADGKCIRGRNGSMLVALEDGRQMVVIGRLLRKGTPEESVLHEKNKKGSKRKDPLG